MPTTTKKDYYEILGVKKSDSVENMRNPFRKGARAQRSGGNASGGGFRDIFSSMFGGRGGAAAQQGPEPGSDLEYQVNVPFWTAIRGGVMRLNITRQDACSNCHGSGHIEAPG